MIISLINLLNKRGPTIEPCGTPVLIDSMEGLHHRFAHIADD